MPDQLANADQLSLEMLGGNSNHTDPADEKAARERTVGKMRLIWNQRRMMLRIAVGALIVSTLIAFVIPKRFESTTRLMPPDEKNSGLALLAAAAGGRSSSSSGGGLVGGLGGGLGSVAGDLLGMKSSGALFVGILQSRTVQDDLITKFNLRKVYRDRLWEDARDDLEELKRCLTQVNTSSAHRERVFLEDRLGQVKQDLESAEKGFSEFASKKTAMDLKARGAPLMEAAPR